ncbi:Uncharacterised protein [Comamonas terrigena]|nr:Uncharacterised protein [Comamonas terrigena]
MHPYRLFGWEKVQVPIPGQVTQPASLNQGEKPE